MPALTSNFGGLNVALTSTFDRFGGDLGSILRRFEDVLGSILGRFKGDLEGYSRKTLWEPQVRSWLRPPEKAAGMRPCPYARLARRSPSEVRAPREGRKVGGCPRLWQTMRAASAAQGCGILGARAPRQRRIGVARLGFRQRGRSPRVTCACA